LKVLDQITESLEIRIQHSIVFIELDLNITVKPDEFLLPFVLILQLDVVRKICPFCNRLNVIYSGFNLNVERLTSTITIIVDSSRHNGGFVRDGDDNLPYHRFMNTREGSIAPSE